MTVQTTTSDVAFAARIRALRAAQWFAAEYAALKSADLHRVRTAMTRPWIRHQVVSCMSAALLFGLAGWAFGVPYGFLAVIPLAVALPAAGDVLAKRHRTGDPLTGRVVADVIVAAVAFTVPIIAGAVIVALLLQRFLGGGSA